MRYKVAGSHPFWLCFVWLCSEYIEVSGHAVATVQHQTTMQKMNRQTNASAKSKEVQAHPQADTQLHHICFCPTAQTAVYSLLNILRH
jgi:hypothetical protein